METSTATKASTKEVTQGRGREAGAVAMAGLGSLFVFGGFIVAIIANSFPPGLLLIVALGSVALSGGLEIMRRHGQLTLFRPRDEEVLSPSALRTKWTRVKVLSLVLGLVAMIVVLILFAALSVRLGIPGLEDFREEGPFTRPLAALGIIVIIAAVATFVASLRLRFDLPINEERAPLSIGLMAACIVLAIGGMALGMSSLEGTAGLWWVDAPFLLVASVAAAGLQIYPARGVPTPMSALLDERDYYHGHVYLTFGKSVLMPVLMALALVLALVLGVVISHTGLGGFVGNVVSNRGAMVGFGGLLLTLLGIAGGATYLLLREDAMPVYKGRMEMEQKVELGLIITSVSLAVLGLIGTLMVANGRSLPFVELAQHRWVDVLAVGLLGGLGPYGFYYARRAGRQRKLEAKFPDLLRDIASGRKAGLTLEASVIMAARGDYGELTPEIRKMADQLSWNMPFAEALEQFRLRVNTPLIERAVSVINEASRTGGNITQVLNAVARDAQEIKDLEIERRSTMIIYTGIIYIAFMVYLGVIAVLYNTLIPQVLEVSETVASSKGKGFAGISQGLKLSDYRTFYFLAAVAQAVGNGIVAGQFESGRLLNGLRHSFIMVAVAFGAFLMLAA